MRSLYLTLLIALGGVLLTTCNSRSERPPAYTAARVSTSNCTPATNDLDWYTSGQKAPLFEDMGNLQFPITSKNPLTRRYVTQGLVLAYGFNHAEAARSFYHATQLEPDCAMAHWGYAYVLGPNYNAGMEPDNYPRAYEAAQKALALAENGVAPWEKSLITALSKRYAAQAPEDRSALDQDYAEAMREAYADHPDNADVGTLFVESLMDLHPWDLWDKEGQTRPWTPEIITNLDKILAMDPDHAGAHHLYIHAIEASHTPEKGLPSARRLDEGLVPGAGHLVHMPSHIYIRTGDYHAGSLANIAAVKVDSSYITACRAQGAYPLIYHPHNYHFLAATATLEGKSEWAIDAAKRIARHADNDLIGVPALGLLQHFYTIPDYVLVKFGRWDEILNALDGRRDLTYPKVIRSYARGMAHLGKQDIDRAREELLQLRSFAADPSLDSLAIGVNMARSVCDIAEDVLAGEIAASEGRYDDAIRLLQDAIEVEDALAYMEPPDWFFSVRHHLGAVLLESGRFAEAIPVYEEDLLTYPKNGWALHGLRAAYKGLSDEKMEATVADRLEGAWATADVDLNSSRIK
ncbi:tetratricopeptide (TPR) repeat protein [Lewinella aquimaris]|uniref:Tetratricopeptide (TPR) repeat protein n=1 Tax=Neolewinella aquimaris TaxID=1835722 RepID=A0A840E9Q7_9BACT|nr:tetratricopeptide repeat protein [Neolewinella aquimaris]MBB4080285.1 tetratricopeptide (TPR) repeat protein [Neolewinella aquimaris]